jgi:hypothetical protein
MAHLVFADTRPKAEKPKEPFFANATTEKTNFGMENLRTE